MIYENGVISENGKKIQGKKGFFQQCLNGYENGRY